MEKKIVLAKDIKQFCSFRAAGRLFGVDILTVKEITSETEFTPVFHAPPEVKGYLNIRGQIHLVVDLKKLIGIEDTSEDKGGGCVVLFKPDVGESFGIFVDKIGDVIEADMARMEKHNGGDNHSEADSIITGTYKLERELVVILDSRRILDIVQEQTA